MNLSLIKRFLFFIKSIFELKLILIGFFLSATLKLPFKFFLVNLDLMFIYPLVSAVFSCVVALTINLLKNRPGLSVNKYRFIFTFSLFLSLVISYIINSDYLSTVLSLIATNWVYSQILCIEDASSTNQNINETGQGSTSISWLEFSSQLGTKIEEEIKGRLENLAPNATPSNRVSLSQIGVVPGTPEWDRLSVFTRSYNGDDKAVITFCKAFNKDSHASVRSATIVYSLSKHHASVQGKILEAISKGL